jgi:negative regulator of sigma E activity
MKETLNKIMPETIRKNVCARAEDLVAYLYNEATRDEARDFETHLHQCASCRTDIATFSDVREAMGGWREQALGSLASPALEAEATRAFTPAVVPARRRSALVALREFFMLSPAWMRGATAALALAFCALAAIAVAYFVRQPQTVIVEKQINSGYTEEELQARIAQALKQQNASQVKDAPAPSPEGVKIANTEQTGQSQIKRNVSGNPQTAINNRRRQPVQRNGVQPSMELASTDYLPFTASGDDEKLPALADLVDEDN